jgi:hypothetical protein
MAQHQDLIAVSDCFLHGGCCCLSQHYCCHVAVVLLIAVAGCLFDAGAAAAPITCCDVSASTVVLGLSQCCLGRTGHLLCRAGPLIGLNPEPRLCLAGGQWLDCTMPADVQQCCSRAP